MLHVTLVLALVNLTYIYALCNNDKKKNADWREKSKPLSLSEICTCSCAVHTFLARLLVLFLCSNTSLVRTTTAQTQKASGETRNVTG